MRRACAMQSSNFCSRCGSNWSARASAATASAATAGAMSSGNLMGPVLAMALRRARDDNDAVAPVPRPILPQYPMTAPPGKLFCFGLGYSALALAEALLAEGWAVAGTVRSQEK